MRQRRHSCSLVPLNHDDGAYLKSLEAITLPRDVTPTGYVGHGKHDSKAAQDLLHELGLSVPFYPPNDPKTSKAYDPNNTFPDRHVTHAARVGSEFFETMEEMRHIEAQALKIARQIAWRSKEPHVLRRMLRKLFDHCDTARYTNRVIAFAMSKAGTREALQHCADPISKALYRSRVYATDRRIYSVYAALITRLHDADLKVDPTLYSHCIKFAARSRDLNAMQKALWLYRSRNIDMGLRTFRSTVAKFSIGINGWGEIRNGKWDREELISVITGFKDTKIMGGQIEDHHFGSFLKREEWTYLSAWIQILAHCRLTDRIWHEWTLYRDSPHRIADYRVCRDEFFISYMANSGDLDRAWSMLNESGLSFWDLRVGTRSRLTGYISVQNASARSRPGSVTLEEAWLTGSKDRLEALEQLEDSDT